MKPNKELIDAIKYLADEVTSLSEQIEELKQVNQRINEKLYLTNEYLSTMD